MNNTEVAIKASTATTVIKGLGETKQTPVTKSHLPTLFLGKSL